MDSPSSEAGLELQSVLIRCSQACLGLAGALRRVTFITIPSCSWGFRTSIRCDLSPALPTAVPTCKGKLSTAILHLLLGVVGARETEAQVVHHSALNHELFVLHEQCVLVGRALHGTATRGGLHKTCYQLHERQHPACRHRGRAW